ncbi:MAG: cytochrome bd-I oxidase subunit CydX [Pseudomonadota bacterium]
MWYFAWVLGLGLAAAVGILNAMWFELKNTRHAPPATDLILPPTDEHSLAE